MVVALFQCSCGVRVEMEPRFGDEITSVSHIHRSARLDGTSAIVRMEEIRVPVAPDPTHLTESTPVRPSRRTACSTSPGRSAVSADPEHVLGGCSHTPVAVSRADCGSSNVSGEGMLATEGDEYRDRR